MEKSLTFVPFFGWNSFDIFHFLKSKGSLLLTIAKRAMAKTGPSNFFDDLECEPTMFNCPLYVSLNLQIISCKAEAFLKLHQLEDADSSLSDLPKLEPYPSSCSQVKFFGMLSEAYVLYVRAQVDMALGRWAPYYQSCTPSISKQFSFFFLFLVSIVRFGILIMSPKRNRTINLRQSSKLTLWKKKTLALELTTNGW